MVKLPWFKIGSIATAVGGAVATLWYEMLSPKQQQDADQMAHDLAVELFKKQLGQLTPAEVREVHNRLKAHFG